MASTGIQCPRCGRWRTPQQVEIFQKTRGATIYVCRDEDDCIKHQPQNKEDSPR